MAAKKKTKKKVTKKVGKAARSVTSRTKVGGTASKRRTATKAKAKSAAGKPRRAARRSREAIMAILVEAKSCGSNAEVIRKHNLSPTTFYSWKRKHGTGRRKRSK